MQAALLSKPQTATSTKYTKTKKASHFQELVFIIKVIFDVNKMPQLQKKLRTLQSQCKQSNGTPIIKKFKLPQKATEFFKHLYTSSQQIKMVNKKKYKFRGLVLMFKKGNCLSISINSNINLSATQLHAIHHPAGSLSHLWRLKLNHTAPLGLSVLHLDVGVQHVATFIEFVL